ncbi:MAG: NUDIX domain-containing protein, partial [Paracoccaceae bacterium]
LAFYAAVVGQGGRDVSVGGSVVPAFGVRAERNETEVVATAGDIMALCGVVKPEAVGARLGVMQVRGASRVRAGLASPAGRRLAGDVAVTERRQPYARFFAVEEYDLAYRRFDRSLSPVVTRAVFVSGDAVTVLPYDRFRDRVLVIEQFRAGPFARGDGNPWSLEAIAGRIDPGEGPEDCARREAVEEAGLALGELLPVAQYYPSPGAVSEYLYSYVGLADLPDGVEGVFGVEGEAEDIRGHLMSFDDLMGLVGSGEVENAPLILTALWLQRERGRLRAERGPAPAPPGYL